MSSNLVIAAIPAEDDYVWKISSEKKPHLTLLFLGDAMSNPNVNQIVEFVEHAAKGLRPTTLHVDHRGELGVDQADVLFFQTTDQWGMQQLKEFRDSLLQNNNIRAAYDSTTQFPVWQPHLTLGYPETPAKEDTRDYPGIRYVEFDRIAVWYGDYEGPEFRLEYTMDMDVAWSDPKVKDLQHYGIKGMRWGVRRSNPSGSSASPPSSDSATANAAKDKAKTKGVHTLSNAELKVLTERMQLEQSLKRLQSSTPKSPAVKFVADVLSNVAKQQVSRLAADAAAKAVAAALKK